MVDRRAPLQLLWLRPTIAVARGLKPNIHRARGCTNGLFRLRVRALHAEMVKGAEGREGKETNLEFDHGDLKTFVFALINKAT